MKKVFLSLMAICLISLFASNVQAQEDDVQLNLTLTVDKYIETAPGPLAWNLGTTVHSASRNTEQIYGTMNEWNIAYANCAFRVDVKGDNPASQGKPRFARLETGSNASGYDILPTLYKIYVHSNGQAKYLSGAGTMVQEAGNFPLYGVFDEAPHNGQVKMSMEVFVNTALATDPGAGGVKQTVIDPNYTWDRSADAGEYSCSMVFTFAAL